MFYSDRKTQECLFCAICMVLTISCKRFPNEQTCITIFLLVFWIYFKYFYSSIFFLVNRLFMSFAKMLFLIYLYVPIVLNISIFYLNLIKIFFYFIGCILIIFSIFRNLNYMQFHLFIIVILLCYVFHGITCPKLILIQKRFRFTDV